MNALYEKDEVPPRAADLQFASKCLSTLAVVALAMHKAAEAAGKECARQERIYQVARRDSEILDALREEQFLQFRLEENRRDQKRLDEAHSLVRANRVQFLISSNNPWTSDCLTNHDG